jgi:phosphoserine phosphatase
LEKSEKHKDAKALAVLDMDGTLLNSRSIDILCHKFGLQTQLKEIDKRSNFLEDYKVSEAIAPLFTGMKASDLKRVFDGISVVHGANEFIDFLKERKFLTAIITDSYTFLALRLAEKLNIDIVTGNKMEIIGGVITGRIEMPLGWKKQEDCQKKAVCKLNAMYDIAQKHEIGMEKTLAIGDSKGDFCMLERAALGVAFRPKDSKITKIADLVVYGDFFELVDKLKPFLDCFQ